MKTTLYHISDTIAKNDTTVKRLQLQYDLILHELWCSDQYQIEFIWVPFGDSITTAYRLRTILSSLLETHQNNSKTITICVNNASRAKHQNSWNAKGSQCLRWTIDCWFPCHVVWVDTDVFSCVRDLFKEIRIVHDIMFWKRAKKDISQWSQFRSLEFFPLVQLLVQTWHDAQLRVEPVDLQSYFSVTPWWPVVDYKVPTLHYNTIEWRVPLQDIQLLWQAKKFWRDRWLEVNQSTIHSLSSNVATYNKIIDSLAPQQLCILDRDHFANTKCLSTFYDWVEWLAKNLQINLWSEVTISWQQEWKTQQTSWFLVSSISDKTWFPCLWNWSSRWPNWEKLVELNYSIDDSWTIREEIACLPLGTILTIEPYRL